MINILPYKEKRAVERIRKLRMLTVALWAMFILTLSQGILFSPILLLVNTRFTLASAQMRKLETEGKLTKPLDVLDLEYRSRTLATKLAAPVLVAPMTYIEYVKQAAPQGVSLTGFNMADAAAPVLNVVGVATSREQLQRFISQLQKEEHVATVDSPVSNFVKTAQSQFSITVTFKKQS